MVKAMTFIEKKIERPSRVSIPAQGAGLALLLHDGRGHPAAQATVSACLDFGRIVTVGPTSPREGETGSSRKPAAGVARGHGGDSNSDWSDGKSQSTT